MRPPRIYLVLFDTYNIFCAPTSGYAVIVKLLEILQQEYVKLRDDDVIKGQCDILCSGTVCF